MFSSWAYRAVPVPRIEGLTNLTARLTEVLTSRLTEHLPRGLTKRRVRGVEQSSKGA